MANPIYQLRRLGKVYAAKEVTFNTAATLASTDAIRHSSIQLNRPTARVDSPERHPHPSLIYRYTRRAEPTWSLGGLLYPAGTIQVAPDMGDLFEAGFGATTLRAVSTTVSASPTPTATGATVAAAGALAVGDGVLIAIAAGQYAGKYVRVLTGVATNALTWAPALPAAPATGDAVKGCATYKLTTAVGPTLDLAHYLPNVSYEGLGCVCDSLKFTLDSNDEIKWEASGPMASRTRPAQTVPAAFTTVGTAPPSGLTGNGWNDAVAQEFIKASIEVANAYKLDNIAYGTSVARGFYRSGQRKVSLSLSQLASDDTVLITDAEAATNSAMLLQTGVTEGSIIAFYAPVWEPTVPDDADGDEVTELSYNGICKGSTSGVGNDELTLVIA